MSKGKEKKKPKMKPKELDVIIAMPMKGKKDAVNKK
jgi:hypothetical protein